MKTPFQGALFARKSVQDKSSVKPSLQGPVIDEKPTSHLSSSLLNTGQVGGQLESVLPGVTFNETKSVRRAEREWRARVAALSNLNDSPPRERLDAAQSGPVPPRRPPLSHTRSQTRPFLTSPLNDTPRRSIVGRRSFETLGYYQVLGKGETEELGPMKAAPNKNFAGDILYARESNLTSKRKPLSPKDAHPFMQKHESLSTSVDKAYRTNHRETSHRQLPTRPVPPPPSTVPVFPRKKYSLLPPSSTALPAPLQPCRSQKPHTRDKGKGRVMPSKRHQVEKAMDLTPGMEDGIRPPKSGLPRSELEKWLANTVVA
ncbi:hypothetical protein L204_105383 [Cryptococcus depauperatus]|nr:hypothetical protein L204_02849 [Cryptococcus depauperatus CBS 7855]